MEGFLSLFHLQDITPFLIDLRQQVFLTDRLIKILHLTTSCPPTNFLKHTIIISLLQYHHSL